jgi:hypothetical protein
LLGVAPTPRDFRGRGVGERLLVKANAAAVQPEQGLRPKNGKQQPREGERAEVARGYVGVLVSEDGAQVHRRCQPWRGFTLTPALSPGERENDRGATQAECDGHRHTRADEKRRRRSGARKFREESLKFRRRWLARTSDAADHDGAHYEPGHDGGGASGLQEHQRCGPGDCWQGRCVGNRCGCGRCDSVGRRRREEEGIQLGIVLDDRGREGRRSRFAHRDRDRSGRRFRGEKMHQRPAGQGTQNDQRCKRRKRRLRDSHALSGLPEKQ